jgi:hypothetical protein
LFLFRSQLLGASQGAEAQGHKQSRYLHSNGRAGAGARAALISLHPSRPPGSRSRSHQPRYRPANQTTSCRRPARGYSIAVHSGAPAHASRRPCRWGIQCDAFFSFFSLPRWSARSAAIPAHAGAAGQDRCRPAHALPRQAEKAPPPARGHACQGRLPRRHRLLCPVPGLQPMAVVRPRCSAALKSVSIRGNRMASRKPRRILLSGRNPHS